MLLLKAQLKTTTNGHQTSVQKTFAAASEL
jgi:hypothetical protein